MRTCYKKRGKNRKITNIFDLSYFLDFLISFQNMFVYQSPFSNWVFKKRQRKWVSYRLEIERLI